MKTMHSLTLATVLGAATLLAPSAKAADFSFGLNFFRPQPVFAPAPQRLERQWVPGYYETRDQQVLVSPEHTEKVWVPAVYRNEVHGRHVDQVLVTPGYYRDVCVPAQYQTVAQQVWVEGYYKDVVVAPRYPGPTFAPAIGVTFNDHNDHRNDWTHGDRNDNRNNDHRNDNNNRNDNHNDKNDHDGRPGYR